MHSAYVCASIACVFPCTSRVCSSFLYSLQSDLTLANVEMAQFNRVNLRNAVVSEMYVSGATLFEGIKDIEGSDWTDTYLRGDQRKYLCAHPTAKGTNPTTGNETRDSLLCKD